MGLNAQPSGERVHIGFFGLRNAGKSSVVNRVTGQTLSIVSDVKGTTTDPVQKAMELLPIGPVVIIDTPGIDDEGTLGEERVRRALRVLEKTDIAVLVTDMFEDIPYHRLFAIDDFLSRFYRLNDTTLDKFTDNKRFIQFGCHIFGQTAFVHFQFGTYDDNRTRRIIDTFTQQVLAETSLLTFQTIGKRL